MGTGQRHGPAGSREGAAGAMGERRWPMAAAVLVAAVLQLITPRRGRVPGWWLFPLLEIVVLAVVIVQDPGRIDRRGVVGRRLTIALIAVMTVGTMAGLVVLIHDILVGSHALTATTLLARGATLWATNVIVFSLWFWEFDRGGPVERAMGSAVLPTFAFPENTTPELAPPGWYPTYPDYLYVAFTNATAFSPTDTMPIRTWAKMTMMVQAAMSLATGILVIARAINIL